MNVFENNAFKVLMQPFGEYQTNCYVAFDKNTQESLIIDAGINAINWVLQNVKKPLEILNTHGHFDHTWSNAALKEHFAQIPLLCPFEDAFMLKSDCFSTGLPSSTPDILVGAKEGEKIEEKMANIQNLNRKNCYSFNNFSIEFICYPGHTPGCSVIILSHKEAEEKIMFSGDFIFYRSIGRSDFPYSSSEVMKKSLESFLNFEENMPVFPGHGGSTDVFSEKENIPYWLARI